MKTDVAWWLDRLDLDASLTTVIESATVTLELLEDEVKEFCDS